MRSYQYSSKLAADKILPLERYLTITVSIKHLILYTYLGVFLKGRYLPLVI